MSKKEKRYTVSEVAEKVGRSAHSVRLWDRYSKLPTELMAQRDDSGWRYWTEEQVEGIKIWLLDIYPGKGIYTR
jgi:DNA-binding transcriptional MerR regulator